MFGSRRNKIKEQIKEIFIQMKHPREAFEQRMEFSVERETQIQEDFSQVMENTQAMIAYTTQSIEEETLLIHTMDILSKQLQTAMQEHQQIAELVKESHEAATNLVEDNKHYTTPSKYLTEVPGKLKQAYQSYEEQTESLATRAREMSVQALNVAVEAGRMGETSKKFVAASEDMRQMALECEKSAVAMKEELQASQERVQELEDYIVRLVALIKDGNVGTTRLMKKYMELHKAIDESSMRDFSEDIMYMRDKVIIVRNTEEELLKVSERNKIQLTDVQEEVQTQQQEFSQLKQELGVLFEDVEEQFRQNDLLI